MICSVFDNHNAQKPTANLDVMRILQAIKSPRPRVASLIAQIRAETDKEKRRSLKSQLPAICFGAQLKTRSSKTPLAEKIEAESGLICLDFDSLPDAGMAKAHLEGKKYILSVFVSPSGNGLKVLVPIAGPFLCHWRALCSYMASEYQLSADEARKDVCGLCYASYDPAIWISADPSSVELFAAISEEPQPMRLPVGGFAAKKTEDGDVLSEYLDLKKAEDALSFLSPDMDYPDWLAVGQAIHCQFGGSGTGLGLWDAWSSRGGKYKGTEDVGGHYQSFRASGVNFRTVLKKAIEAGYKIPRGISERPREIVPEQVEEKINPLCAFIASEMDGSFHLAPWPWPILTNLSKSLYPGAITILCGAPGASKSWFGLACLDYWTKNKIDAHVLMLEEKKVWHLNRLLTMLDGNKDFLDPAKVRANPDLKIAALARHNDRLMEAAKRLHCSPNITTTACADWVEKRCNEGARVLVIDPITLADHGSEKPWDADRRFIARCGAAAAKSGTSIILVTHPRKAQGVQKGPPQMDDLSGGAAFSRAAASVIWIGPSGQTEEIETDGGAMAVRADRQVRILKSRNGVGTGKVIIYQFNNFTFEEIGISEAEKPSRGKGAIAGEVRRLETAKRKTNQMAQQPSESEDLWK